MSPSFARIRMHTTRIVLTATLAALIAVSAQGQDVPNHQSNQAVGAGVFLHVQARVLKTDALTNSVTLKGPRGHVAVIEVNPDVADVKKLQVGDTVNIAYRSAILISADKIESTGIRERVETQLAQPASGGTVAAARKVEVVATVRKIDLKRRLITLRGPDRTETFDVVPDIALDTLRIGDFLRAVFVAAAAASVSRNGIAVK